MADQKWLGVPAAPRKDDHGKRMWRLLPWEALADAVDVLTWACTRKDPPPYGAESWRDVPNAVDRYHDALLRHLTEWSIARREGKKSREVVDSQSGLPVLGHALCDLLFIVALERS
jgi:Domain of unknown function (DUF5664)